MGPVPIFSKTLIIVLSKHLHFRDNWLLCSGQRFWEIVAATIEERLRLYGSKTRCNFSFVFYVYISEIEK